MSTISLRKILLYNYLYILILFLVIVFSIPRLFINKTLYKEGPIKEEFIIKKIGIGAGKRKYDIPNVVRAMMIEVK